MSWDYNIGTMAFPGGLVVRILGFHCHGLGSVPVGKLKSCKLLSEAKKKIYIYIYIYTHTHIYVHIMLYIYHACIS